MLLTVLTDKMVQPVPERIDFSKQEEVTLAFWTKHDAFKTSLELSKNKKRLLIIMFA